MKETGGCERLVSFPSVFGIFSSCFGIFSMWEMTGEGNGRVGSVGIFSKCFWYLFQLFLVSFPAVLVSFVGPLGQLQIRGPLSFGPWRVGLEVSSWKGELGLESSSMSWGEGVMTDHDL